LKLLPTEFTNHQERLRRFIQDAKATSSLNHTNIITIYEIGEPVAPISSPLSSSTGKYSSNASPRKWMCRRFDVSVQVVGVLQATHAAGIVHRDY
jgi:serine/threonine protein kinase